VQLSCSCFRRLPVCIPLLRRREECRVRLVQELLLLLGALLSVFLYCAGAKKAECGSCKSCSCFWAPYCLYSPTAQARRRQSTARARPAPALGVFLSVFPLLRRREEGRVRPVARAAPALGVLLSVFSYCAGAKKAECGSYKTCSCFRRLTVCIPHLRRREEG
jgi:hypothetical protein